MTRADDGAARVTSTARARRRRRRNVTIATVLTVVLCAVGGGVAFAATRPAAADYRTATASIGNVTQTVNLTGTVASASRKDVAFQASGTVASVAVALGQKVSAGQTLATLDPDSLAAAVTTAQQAVTQATQTVADDLASQTASATSNSSSSASSTSSTSGSSSSGSTSASSTAIRTAVKSVEAAQQKLLAQYAVAQTSLAATQALVDSSTPTCKPFLDATLDGTTPTDATTPTDPTGSTPADQLAAAKAALATCQTAISDAITSEQATAAAQKLVQQLGASLDDAVTALTKAAATSTSGGASSGPSGTSTATATPAATTSSARSGSTGASGGTSSVASAATVLADQTAVTAAKATLAIAVRNESLGTLTSPIAGTVAAVSVTTGSTVSAGSTSDVITIIGNDGYVVSSTVPLTSVAKLKVGQSAVVTVASSTKKFAAKLSSIGLLNVSTTSTTPSYDVSFAITDEAAKLLNGATAALAVTADTADGVLTVPTSALHRSGQRYTVDVSADGTLVATVVTIGASGAQLTQIKSGLARGAEVILADVSSTTIGDSTSTSTSTGLGGLTSGSRTGAGTFPAGGNFGGGSFRNG